MRRSPCTSFFLLLSFSLSLLLFSACTSTMTQTTNLTTKLTRTITETCGLYRQVRPQVVAYREWAMLNWDTNVTVPDGTSRPMISSQQKDLLVKLNSYLPALEKTGVQVCAVADLAMVTSRSTVDSTVSAGRKIDWDDVLSTVIKVAGTAVQLKAQGAF